MALMMCDQGLEEVWTLPGDSLSIIFAPWPSVLFSAILYLHAEESLWAGC